MSKATAKQMLPFLILVGLQLLQCSSSLQLIMYLARTTLNIVHLILPGFWFPLPWFF